MRKAPVLLLGVLLLAVGLLTGCRGDGTTYTVVIPRGEWQNRTGNVLDPVPQRTAEDGGTVLTLKTGDTLVVVNDDEVEHVIGLVAVRPGETVTHTFTQTGEFEGACTLLSGERVTISVT
jgi:hypothetical protein